MIVLAGVQVPWKFYYTFSNQCFQFDRIQMFLTISKSIAGVDTDIRCERLYRNFPHIECDIPTAGIAIERSIGITGIVAAIACLDLCVICAGYVAGT